MFIKVLVPVLALLRRREIAVIVCLDDLLLCTETRSSLMDSVEITNAFPTGLRLDSEPQGVCVHPVLVLRISGADSRFGADQGFLLLDKLRKLPEQFWSCKHLSL